MLSIIPMAEITIYTEKIFTTVSARVNISRKINGRSYPSILNSVKYGDLVYECMVKKSQTQDLQKTLPKKPIKFFPCS